MNDRREILGSDDQAKLASDLALVIIRLARKLRCQRVNSPVSITQLSALATLLAEGPMSPGALAAHERVRPPSMTRILAALEELGLIARTGHPADGRQTIVALSKQGTELIEADNRDSQRWLHQHLNRLTSDQQALLRQATDLLAELVTGAPQSS